MALNDRFRRLSGHNPGESGHHIPDVRFPGRSRLLLAAIPSDRPERPERQYFSLLLRGISRHEGSRPRTTNQATVSFIPIFRSIATTSAGR